MQETTVSVGTFRDGYVPSHDIGIGLVSSTHTSHSTHTYIYNYIHTDLSDSTSQVFSDPRVALLRLQLLHRRQATHIECDLGANRLLHHTAGSHESGYHGTLLQTSAMASNLKAKYTQCTHQTLNVHVSFDFHPLTLSLSLSFSLALSCSHSPVLHPLSCRVSSGPKRQTWHFSFWEVRN